MASPLWRSWPAFFSFANHFLARFVKKIYKNDLKLLYYLPSLLFLLLATSERFTMEPSVANIIRDYRFLARVWEFYRASSGSPCLNAVADPRGPGGYSLIRTQKEINFMKKGEILWENVVWPHEENFSKNIPSPASSLLRPSFGSATIWMCFGFTWYQ